MSDGVDPLRFTQPRVWVVPALSLLGAVVLVVTGGNEPVFLLINRLGPATYDVLWASLTILGDTVVALSLGLLLARRRPDLLWAVVPAALLASVWVQVYKPILDVMRPPAVLGNDSIHVIGPAYHYHSFPSGHATTAFALAGLCVLGFRLGPWSLAPLALAVLVAVSRTVVGVHWPLDLVAGACGGWLAAVLGLKLGARASFGLRPAAQWIIALAFAGCAVALLAGYDTGYPQAIWFQRAIAIFCLGAFALTFVPNNDSRAARG
jgi:membrane-associated phospholipid phosphatase